MIRQRIIVKMMGLGLLLGLSGLIAGCGKPSAPAPPGAQKPPVAQKPRVALIMKSLANEFFKTMENGARAQQRLHAQDYDLLVNGIKDEQDVSRQIDLVEQMMAQRVSAIVIAPADSGLGFATGWL